MLYNLIFASFDLGETILQWIEVATRLLEVLAVAIIVIAIFYSIGRYAYERLRGREHEDTYAALKGSLGRSMLLGLEILVAADIVSTVALESTLESVAMLGLLVLIRTFLSWALEVEISGRWPWQSGPERDPESGGSRGEEAG
jgi:uncharacterized membrane protein